MDFEEKKAKPDSTRKFLISQVEEQSNCCDVTVKVGRWEKRFHRCVLMKSPFFESMFKNEYREIKTGQVEVHLGTPLTVEMALMFLYGKKPKLATENIEIMLALAEFFLIPSLKAVCVSWLKDEPVEESNCFVLLKLASIYDVELPECTKFVEGRLNGLLETDEFLQIDLDSVEYIFIDRKFAYLTMDQRVKFLKRWVNFDLNRKDKFSAILELIDFRENSLGLLKELEKEPLFTDSTLKQKLEEAKQQEDTTHNVLLQKCGYGNMFWCLDLNREKWFQLDLKHATEERESTASVIRGVHNTEGVVYCEDEYRNQEILHLNLESGNCRTLSIIKEVETGSSYARQIAITGDICIITEKKVVKKANKHMTDYDYRLNRDLMSLSFLHYGQITASSVFIGYVKDEFVEIEPVLTVCNEELSNVCLSSVKTVLFLTKSKTIMVYDFHVSKLVILKEKASVDDKTAALENGFVVFNKERCIYLQKRNEPVMENLYRVQTLNIKSEIPANNSKLFFCHDRWYRYYSTTSDGYKLEWISHKNLLARDVNKRLSWKPLPLPYEDPKCSSYTLSDHVFQIRLSKNTLQCDIDCPHCKALKEKSNKRTRIDSDEEFYNDSSDSDDYVGSNFVFYDTDTSSDYYYYDSD